MWLAVLVDVIAISPRIAIILFAVNYGANKAAEHTAYYRARTGANAWNNGTRDGSDAGPDHRSCADRGYLTVLGRSCTAT